MPEKIYSDNGKTFVGAEKWLKQIMRDEKTQNYLPHENIKWQFNLSRAALWGGQFERFINQLPELKPHHLREFDPRRRAKYLRRCK